MTKRPLAWTKAALATGLILLCACPGWSARGAGSGSAAALPCPEPSRNTPGAVTTAKWDLWAGGTKLRGANIYQQNEAKETDGGGNFGPHLRAVDFRMLRDSGANYVNLSVPGPYHVQSNTPWPEAAAHLNSMVLWAKAAGLFTVISIRTGPGRGEGDITGDGLPDHSVYHDSAEQAAWLEMWRSIALRYRDMPHVVGYELMVEPHDVLRETWRPFAQRMVNAIRDVDANTPILVSPANWGQVSSLAGWTPLCGDGLVYTVHQYEPRPYTHGKAPSYSEAVVRRQDTLMRNWLDANPGRRLVVNEFGVNRTKRGAAGFLRLQLGLLEGLGVNHAAWLWEVSDTSAGSHDTRFDFKRDSAQMQALKNNWRNNTIFAAP